MPSPRKNKSGRTPLPLSERQAKEMSLRIKVATDASRLKILLILSAGERNVTAIREELGQAQAVVSQQLSLLRVAGLIRGERHSRYIHYSLDDMGWALIEMIRCQVS